MSTLFSAVEILGDSLLAWLPFYYEAKTLFILWLVLPKYKGAKIIYEKFLDRQLRQYVHGGCTEIDTDS